MSDVSSARPVWAAKAIVRAIWVAAGESPEWIATRTDALLSQLQGVFDIAHWETPQGQRWEGPIEMLADIVRSFVVRARPTLEDPLGEALPRSGYFVSLYGAGPRVGIDVRVSAGLISSGGRLPGHHLTIDLRESSVGGVTGEAGDFLCAAVARTWEPATLKLSDSIVNSLARRGNWKIGVGYRVWISDEVGSFAEVADGLTSKSLAGGTLVSAPDDWPAERVVEAMTATLAANGLDEVPH